MSTTQAWSSETLSRVVRHVIAPAATVLTLVTLFFSGEPALAALIAPQVNRELGVLEHLQLVPLVAVSAWGAAACCRERILVWRWVFVGMSGGALFLLLEEVNYGQHYLALLTGTGAEQEIGPRSLHNFGDATDWMKLAGDIGIGVFFVVVPLIRQMTGKALLGPVTPSLWYLTTVAVMVIVSQVPHLLAGGGADAGPLRSNLSEFRELMVYYLGALFSWEVIRSRRVSPRPLEVAVDGLRRFPESRAA